MYRLDELKRQLEQSVVPSYAEDLQEEAVKDTAVTIVQISAERLRDQERAVADVRKAEQEKAAERHRRTLEKIAKLESEAVKRVQEQEHRALDREQILKEKRLLAEKARMRNSRVGVREGREQVEMTMRKQSKRLRKQAGVLSVDKTASLKLLSSWRLSAALSTAPQPIKIQLRTLRAVKVNIPVQLFATASLGRAISGNALSCLSFFLSIFLSFRGLSWLLILLPVSRLIDHGSFACVSPVYPQQAAILPVTFTEQSCPRRDVCLHISHEAYAYPLETAFHVATCIKHACKQRAVCKDAHVSELSSQT